MYVYIIVSIVLTVIISIIVGVILNTKSKVGPVAVTLYRDKNYKGTTTELMYYSDNSDGSGRKVVYSDGFTGYNSAKIKKGYKIELYQGPMLTAELLTTYTGDVPEMIPYDIIMIDKTE